MITVDSNWIKRNIGLFKGKRVVIVNGAGISVASGIPDFRSKSGIFDEIRRTLKVNGNDLFTYRYSVDKENRKSYLRYMSKLKSMVETSEPSLTHRFLKVYSEVCGGFRIYTQNIDGLEEKAGFRVEKSKHTKLVYLHGNMKELGCLYCGYRIPFTEKERAMYEKEEEITCDSCMKRNKRRDGRERPVGVFHTTIIHYHQSHPDSSFISKMAELDSSCNLFIVIGTSLKVFGVEKLVKYFCRLDNTKGRRIFVNLEKPNRGFSDLFDFFWQGDCDDFCRNVGDGLGLHEITENMSMETDKKDLEDLCEDLSTIQISPMKKDDGKQGKKIEQSDEKDVNVNRTKKAVKSKNRKKRNKQSSKKIQNTDFAISDTVVKNEKADEHGHKELLSSTLANTPKRKTVSGGNVRVENEIQEYVNSLIKSSEKPSGADIQVPSKKSKLKTSKKDDMPVREDGAIRCTKGKVKKV